MKTQCPKCKQIWYIESNEVDQSMECFYCKSKFDAAPYTGPVPKESPPAKPKPSGPEEPVEYIDSPGGVWYFVGAVVGVLGIFFGLLEIEQGGLPVILSAAMFWLVATAVGGVLNRLERIAYHTEKLHIEMKKSKEP